MSKDVEKSKSASPFQKATKKGVPLLAQSDQEAILAEAQRTNNYSQVAKKYGIRVENLYRWKKARDKRNGRAPAGMDVAGVRPTAPAGRGELEQLREEVAHLRSALISVTLEKERLLKNR